MADALLASCLQADLRQYVNDLLLKTGGVAAPGNPVITCKLYPVRSRCLHRLEPAAEDVAFRVLPLARGYISSPNAKTMLHVLRADRIASVRRRKTMRSWSFVASRRRPTAWLSMALPSGTHI